MTVEEKNRQFELVSEVSWSEIRDSIIQVNPKLAKLIDQIDPDSDLKLIKAFYPYGSLIVDKGSVLLPAYNEKNNEVPLLKSQPAPLMLFLDKSNEVFCETPDRVIPFNLFSPGQIWGSFESLCFHKPTISNCWSISAGARSIFMLPKITDATAHKRIQREFSINLKSPKTLWDHVKIFSAIANSPKQQKQWLSQVIFFTSNWCERLQASSKNQAWLELKTYLHELTFPYSRLWTHYVTTQSIASTLPYRFSTKQGFKLDTGSLDIAKHLINVAFGVSPGFRSAGETEEAAPTSMIEKAYVEVYGLKEYLPILMHPSHLYNQHEFVPCYSSLSLPSHFNNSAKPYSSTNIIYQMRQLKKTLEHLMLKLEEHNCMTLDWGKVKFNFFHTTGDKEHNIQLASDIPSYDPLFLKTYYHYPHREFPFASPFLRGCIQITMGSLELENMLKNKQ